MRKHNKRKTEMRMETVGIDLGDKVSRYCILDPDGDVVEEGVFRNQLSSIEKHFADPAGASHWKPERSQPGSAAN